MGTHTIAEDTVMAVFLIDRQPPNHDQVAPAGLIFGGGFGPTPTISGLIPSHQAFRKFST